MWSIRFKLQLFFALILFSLLSLMIWLYISASCDSKIQQQLQAYNQKGSFIHHLSNADQLQYLCLVSIISCTASTKTAHSSP
jgi:hypothetical protein